jgi:signal transduction histidine kinase
LTNACHAIRERAEGERFAGIITIRTGASEKKVWCEIENNGTPIPVEHRDRIFDLFFSTKKSQWGTGLGLNICRDIVENHHGGKLSLESTDPVIFKIELPIEPARLEGSEVR